MSRPLLVDELSSEREVQATGFPPVASFGKGRWPITLDKATTTNPALICRKPVHFTFYILFVTPSSPIETLEPLPCSVGSENVFQVNVVITLHLPVTRQKNTANTKDNALPPPRELAHREYFASEAPLFFYLQN